MKHIVFSIVVACLIIGTILLLVNDNGLFLLTIFLTIVAIPFWIYICYRDRKKSFLNTIPSKHPILIKIKDDLKNLFYVLNDEENSGIIVIRRSTQRNFEECKKWYYSNLAISKHIVIDGCCFIFDNVSEKLYVFDDDNFFQCKYSEVLSVKMCAPRNIIRNVYTYVQTDNMDYPLFEFSRNYGQGISQSSSRYKEIKSLLKTLRGCFNIILKKNALAREAIIQSTPKEIICLDTPSVALETVDIETVEKKDVPDDKSKNPDDFMSKLEQLSELRFKGTISEEEYETLKNNIIDKELS